MTFTRTCRDEEAIKTDIEIVKHPVQAASALIQIAKEDPKAVAETAGKISGEAAATILMAKGVKAVGDAVASTKVVKLPGARPVVGERMVVNTQSGRAFQLHKPHHGKGIHLQEMKVVPHPKKPGAFRILDNNVKSTTIIPMKDKP